MVVVLPKNAVFKFQKANTATFKNALPFFYEKQIV